MVPSTVVALPCLLSDNAVIHVGVAATHAAKYHEGLHD